MSAEADAFWAWTGMAQRGRAHLTRRARIDGLQLVCGHGDRARVDPEGTLLERARLLGRESDGLKRAGASPAGPGGTGPPGAAGQSCWGWAASTP